MTIRLVVFTVLEIFILAVALIYLLFRIVTSLERIGGMGDSYLAKIRFGVRAIDKETSHLAPEVGRLNEGLSKLAGQLATVDRQLGATVSALSGGKGRSR